MRLRVTRDFRGTDERVRRWWKPRPQVGFETSANGGKLVTDADRFSNVSLRGKVRWCAEEGNHPLS